MIIHSLDQVSYLLCFEGEIFTKNFNSHELSGLKEGDFLMISFFALF